MTLTSGVRFLSISQIARCWCSGDLAAARLLVDTFCRDGLLSVEEHLVHPEIITESPEYTWKPGADEADFGPVAYRLRKRWSKQKELINLVFPEAEACKQYGGVRVRPRPNEYSHDLHFAGVYLGYRDHLRDGEGWVFGDILRADQRAVEFGGSIPDAVIVGSSGEVTRVVEGGGSYGKNKLDSIHQSYARLPYEIW